MIQIPKTAGPAPFQVTRASHLTFTVGDLARSRDFYTEVIGLAVTDEDSDTIYLRGLEERSHHSLVLKRTDDAPSCIKTACGPMARKISIKPNSTSIARNRSQIRRCTIPVTYSCMLSDISGTPLEFCSAMPRVERVDQKFESLRGGLPLRFDHYQVTAPTSNLQRASTADCGFRIWTIWLSRTNRSASFCHAKDSQYDVVFIRRPGPALHHFAYVVSGIKRNHESLRCRG